MKINQEAQIIRECFIPRGTSDSKQVRVEENKIESYLQENKINSKFWENIDYCFEKETNKYCSRCGHDIEFCECQGSPKTKSETSLKIAPDNLVDRWERWVDDTDIFSEFNVDTIGTTPFKISATYNGKDLTIYAVFSVEEYNALDLNSNRPVFAASFFHDSRINQRKNVIPWYHFTNTDFKKELRKKLKRLNKVYSANISKRERISDFDDDVSNALECALNEYGYDTILEPGKIDVADEYRIDTTKATLGFEKDDWEGLLCNCSKSDEWHFHLFNGEDIISVSEKPNIEESIHILRDKIRKYRNIERFKSQTRAKGAAVSGIAALFTALVLSLNFAPVSTFVDNYLPISQNIGFISTVSAIFAVVVVLIYALALFSPFIYEFFIFDWDVSVD